MSSPKHNVIVESFQVNAERHADLRINDTVQASQSQCNEKRKNREVGGTIGQFYL